MEFLQSVLEIVIGLGGSAAFFAALLNLLKSVGLLPDGVAGIVAPLLNLALFIAVGLGQVFGWSIDWSAFDSVFGNLGKIIEIIIGLLSAVGLPAAAHGILKRTNLPMLGTSYSAKSGFVKKLK